MPSLSAGRGRGKAAAAALRGSRQRSAWTGCGPGPGVGGWNQSRFPFTSCPLGAWRCSVESTQGDRVALPHKNPVRSPPVRPASCREAQVVLPSIPASLPHGAVAARLMPLSLRSESRGSGEPFKCPRWAGGRERQARAAGSAGDLHSPLGRLWVRGTPSSSLLLQPGAGKERLRAAEVEGF